MANLSDYFPGMYSMRALYRNSDYTLTNGDLVYSEAGLTYTLPASPVAGNVCSVWDKSDNAGASAITVLRNGNTINGAADDFSLNMDGGRVDFMYDGTGWIYSYVVQTIQPDTTVVKTVSERIYPAVISPVSGGTDVKAGSLSEIDAIGLPSSGYPQGAFLYKFPENWDEGTVRFRVFWSPTSINTGDAAILILGTFLGEGDTYYPGGSTIADVADTALGTADELQITAWGAWTTIPGSGDYDRAASLRIQRNAATDSFTGTVEVLFIEIEYKTEEILIAAVAQSANNQTRMVTGTTDTLLLADNGKEVIYTNAATIAVTLPDDFPEGWNCVITQTTSAGVPTVTPDTDTINGAGSGVAPSGQWKGMVLSKYSSTAYIAKI